MSQKSPRKKPPNSLTIRNPKVFAELLRVEGLAMILEEQCRALRERRNELLSQLQMMELRC